MFGHFLSPGPIYVSLNTVFKRPNSSVAFPQNLTVLTHTFKKLLEITHKYRTSNSNTIFNHNHHIILGYLSTNYNDLSFVYIFL